MAHSRSKAPICVSVNRLMTAMPFNKLSHILLVDIDSNENNGVLAYIREMDNSVMSPINAIFDISNLVMI